LSVVKPEMHAPTNDSMRDNLPKTLQEAMARLLDADADSERRPACVSHVERIHLLRTARGTLSEWREGRLTTDQAIERLDSLAQRMIET
jgi:hypothetical protein